MTENKVAVTKSMHQLHHIGIQ